MSFDPEEVTFADLATDGALRRTIADAVKLAEVMAKISAICGTAEVPAHLWAEMTRRATEPGTTALAAAESVLLGLHEGKLRP